MSKKDLNFKNVESLQSVANVINEASEALNDSKRTIIDSPISDALAGAAGATIGGVGSFAALYALGNGAAAMSLSAAGITSGLAVAGSLVGGGMVAGVFVLAAPIAVLAAGGVALSSNHKRNKLKNEKERLYKEALRKHEAIIKTKNNEIHTSKERSDYLNSLNILLQQAIKDLKADLTI